MVAALFSFHLNGVVLHGNTVDFRKVPPKNLVVSPWENGSSPPFVLYACTILYVEQWSAPRMNTDSYIGHGS